MAARLHWLISDLGNEELPWIVRAAYRRQKEAIAQAQADLRMGRRVLRIEHGTNKQQLEGKAAVVWEPPAG
jgi:hypothetical protein